MNSATGRFMVGATLFAVAALGCVGDDWSLREATRAEDPRFAEIRRRMAITYVRTTEGVTTTTDAEVDAFAAAGVANYCGVPTSCPTGTTGGDCSAHRACAAAHLCVANSLMRILQSPSAWVFSAHPGGIKTDYQIPPQDQPTNVALAEVAAEYADRAATHVDLGIAACNTAGDLGDCANSALTPPQCVDVAGEESNTVAAELAATWIEAFHLRLEATGELHHAALAVADGAYAEYSAASDAAAVGLTAPEVSRSAAAHAWVGGSDGMMGLGQEVDTAGFCPDERLSAEASRAIA